MIHLAQVSKIVSLNGRQKKILDAVSFSVSPGEFVGILGKSGSGKTSLLNIIGLLDPAYSGGYQFQGLDAAQLSGREKAHIRKEKMGFIFQQYNLIEDLKIIDNIIIPRVYNGVSYRQAKEEGEALMNLLDIVPLGQQYPKHLSGGEQQRVAIARALINQPDLILADEPTGALDSHNGGQIMELFSQLNQEGHTLIMVTHDRDLTAYMTRTIYLEDGGVVDEG